ncbi:hypothetical protein C0995_003416 [Termitomyces sp. Mi166|nr:hypothetical protein C0995_003416 [Termitomyces sp. Mi166\
MALKVFLSHGLGVGIATGLSYVPGMAVLSQFFHRRRVIAMGIATTGSAVGGALHPIMLNKLFYGPAGFHGGVRTSAGLCLGLLAIALLLLRPRFRPKKSHISTARVFKDFLRDPPYVIMVCGTTVTYTGLYFPIFFLQLNAIKIGINATLAFYTIAILNGASVFGRIFPNMLVNYVGIFNMVIMCTTITGILVFCPLAIKDVAGTMIFSIMYGFFSGASRNNSEIGARLGICFAFTGIGGLVGTPISGALLTGSYIWWRPFLFSGLCVFTGTFCFIVSRHLSSRVKSTHIL